MTTTTNLAFAKAADAESRTSLTQNEAIKMYAKHLEHQSWCINTAATTTMLFHADSGLPSNLEFFSLDFPNWARSTRVIVSCENGDTGFVTFLGSLRHRVPSRLPRIQGNTFRPSPEKFVGSNGVTLANTYVPFSPKAPTNASVSLAEELLAELFPNENERKLVLQWLAHMVQRPMERPQWGLVITGEGGEGKSLLMQIAEAALGGHHWWRERDFSALTRRFSEVLPDNLLVCLDDAQLPSDAAEKLKHPVTTRYQQVEVKGEQNLQKREVFARLVILSNRVRPLRMQEERRWYCPTRCKNRVSREESSKLGAKVAEWLQQPDTPAAIYHWLMSQDLAGFDLGRCPETETYRLMAEASESQLEQHIGDFLEDNGGQPIFHQKMLTDHLQRQGMSSVAPDVLKAKLADLNYVNKRRPIDGKDERVWQPMAKRSRAINETETAAILRAVGRSF